MEDLCNLTSKLSLSGKKSPSPEDNIFYPLVDHKYFTYQAETGKWMKEQEKKKPNGFGGGIISLSMGLGKTLIVLGYSLAHRGSRPTLIVVPKNILFEWKNNEVNKFFPKSKVLFFHREINKKIDSLTLEDVLNYELVITTYSMCSRACFLGEYHKPREERKSKLTYTDKGLALLYKIKWERVVFDESHKCCNPKTTVFKYIMVLSAKYKWCMTGTPIINYDIDIWAQLRLCGYSDIDTIGEWKRVGVSKFKDRLKNSIYTLKHSDIEQFTLPPLDNRDILLNLSDDHKIIYDILLGQVQQEYNEAVRLNQSYSCVFALMTRLRQSAIAPYIISCEAKRSSKLTETFNLDKDLHGMRSTKILKTIEILKKINSLDENGSRSPFKLFELAYSKLLQINPKYESFLNKSYCIPVFNCPKTIVFSMFVSALDLLGETIKQNLPNMQFVQVDGDTKNREDTFLRFKTNPNIRCLLTTYKIAAEGLNLTEATNCILLEPWWNNATLEQAKARVWRIGQTKPVTVYNLVCKDTIEEKIIEICNKKDVMIDSYLNGTKKCIDNCGLNKALMHKLL
jgi:SNF2 family DNA or RNA helicase